MFTDYRHSLLLLPVESRHLDLACGLFIAHIKEASLRARWVSESKLLNFPSPLINPTLS